MIYYLIHTQITFVLKCLKFYNHIQTTYLFIHMIMVLFLIDSYINKLDYLISYILFLICLVCSNKIHGNKHMHYMATD